MIIAMGSDPAGYELRRQVEAYLSEKGHEILDCGVKNAEKPASYVPVGREVSRLVLSGAAEKGIVICGTGIGMSIVCNKHKGIRCALCSDEFSARMSRKHNDANVLSMGARVIGYGLCISIVEAFLCSAFETGGRHQIRVEEIGVLENHFMDS